MIRSLVCLWMFGTPLHDSNDAYEPEYIFLMSPDTIGDNGDTAVPMGTFYNSTLSNGPIGSQSNAIQFSGADDSYLEIDNTDAMLDGGYAFSWGFYIYPDDVTATAPILDYYGTDGTNGCSLWQTGNLLTFRFSGYAVDNSSGLETPTGDHVTWEYTEPAIELSQNQWNYVDIFYNVYSSKLGINQIKAPGSYETKNEVLTIPDGATHVFPIATGNMRFGNSFVSADNAGFTGRIGCIAFVNMSVAKSTLESIQAMCDPALWTESSRLGRVKEQQAPATSTGVLRPFTFDLQEWCSHFSLLEYNATYSVLTDILDTISVATTRDCMLHCVQWHECQSASVHDIPPTKLCQIGKLPSGTVYEADSDIYALVF